MKTRGNRIQAFTVVEALVSMVVTAIVLAIIFVIFSITSERLWDFKKQNETISDLNRMSYSVNKALFESDRMRLDGQDELLFSDYYGNDFRYHIYQDYFVRENKGYLDTFHLKTRSIVLDELESSSGKAKFQRLKWKLSVDEKDVDMHFYKRIYPAETMNPTQYQ